MTRPQVALLLRAAEALEREGEMVWLASEDMLARAAALKREAEKLRELAAAEADREEAARWLGPTVTVVMEGVEA